jgi:regulator of sigma E protease
MSSVWNVVVTILEFVIAFSLLAFFHEFGHFLFAKLFKIEVEEFGMGYPPRMVKLFKVKETLFSLNWIPFGAFVKPKGENDPKIEGGLAAAKPWKRLLVLLGGPLMNIFIGILIFTFIFTSLGAPDTKTVQVVQINANTPAEQAGMQVGDIIKSVDGIPITELSQLSTYVHTKLGQEITLTLIRNNQEQTLKIIPRANPPEGEGPLGIAMSNPNKPINWFQSIPQAFSWTGETFKQLITLPIRLIRGEIPASQARLVSPIGLYSIYSQSRASQAAAEAKQPSLAVLDIFWFFGNISVLLGLTNLLPIPALDGGHIIFVLPELIFKKRVPAKYENMVHTIGYFLLLALMAYLFIQDIIHPIVLP